MLQMVFTPVWPWGLKSSRLSEACTCHQHSPDRSSRLFSFLSHFPAWPESLLLTLPQCFHPALIAPICRHSSSKACLWLDLSGSFILWIKVYQVCRLASLISDSIGFKQLVWKLEACISVQDNCACVFVKLGQTEWMNFIIVKLHIWHVSRLTESCHFT